MTGRIFISYRRGDSQAAAGRLHDRLLQHFGRDQLFMDVDALEPGVDFVQVLDEQVSNCGIFIAVIGPGWLSAKNAQDRRRLDDPMDYVRIEIELALKRDIRVIPILVDGASMPPESELPPSIGILAHRHAVEIAHHRFGADCDALADAVKRALGIGTPAPTPGHPRPETSASGASPTVEGLSWIEILFSFRGRISRMQFLIGFIAILVSGVAFGVTVQLTVALSQAGGQPGEVPNSLTMLLERRLQFLTTIVFLWPIWALILKRLHDLDHGWKTFLPYVVLDSASLVLDLVGYDERSLQLTLIVTGFGFMLAAIKGTAGLNRYGPDPLAMPASRD